MTVSTQGQCSLRSGAPFRFEQWDHEQVVARPCIAEPVAHGQTRFPIQLLELPRTPTSNHHFPRHSSARSALRSRRCPILRTGHCRTFGPGKSPVRDISAYYGCSIGQLHRTTELRDGAAGNVYGKQPLVRQHFIYDALRFSRDTHKGRSNAGSHPSVLTSSPSWSRSDNSP